MCIDHMMLRNASYAIELLDKREPCPTSSDSGVHLSLLVIFAL